MKRYNLIPTEGNKEELIRESRIRQTVRNAAIALAIIFGSLVLYFCLVPALAEDETDRYIYFDNGLSMYEKVEYSTDGINFDPMLRLSEHPELKPSNMKNVKAEYIWVTPVEVFSGNITFRGTASGRVYDTVSNYQIDSASREWGYDYQNFVWTSDAVEVNSSWNCYFAPALAMQYKYNGTKDGGQTYQDFIKLVNWATDLVEDDTQSAFLNVSDLPLGDSPSFTKTINGITFIGNKFASRDTIRVSAKTIDGETFTNQLYINGTGNSNQRTIQFNASDAGTVKVYVDAEYNQNDQVYEVFDLILHDCNNDKELSSSHYSNGNDGAVLTFTIPKAGNYCIYPNARAHIYGVKVEFSGQAPVTGTVELEELLKPYVEALRDAKENRPTYGGFSENTPSGYERNTFRFSNGTVFTISDNMGYSTWPGPEIELSAYGAATRAPSFSIKIDSVGSGILKFAANLPPDNTSNNNVVLLKSDGTQVTIPNSALSTDRKSYEVPIEKGTYYLGGDGSVFLYSIAVDYSGTSSYSVAAYEEAAEVAAAEESIEPDTPTLPYLGELGEDNYLFGAENEEEGLDESESPEPSDHNDCTDFETDYDAEEVFTDEVASVSEYEIMPIAATDEGTLQSVLNANDLTIEELSSNKSINDYFTITANDDKKVKIDTTKKTADGIEISQRINMGGGGEASYRSIRIKANEAGYIEVYAASSDSEAKRKLIFGKVDSTELATADASENKTSAISPITFSFSEAGEYYITFSGGGGYVFYIKLYYGGTEGGGGGDSGGSDPPAQKYYGRIHPDSGVNRTFYGYTYKMEGITGSVNDNNSIGDRSQAENAEGSYATGSDSTHGLKDKYDEAFTDAKATFFDYYSDWELAGHKLDDHVNYYNDSDDQDTKYISTNGLERLIPVQGDPSSRLFTFFDQTNTVSYTYQGDLWNQAIRDYYNGLSALYFGSNSWFTGNNRYTTSDRYGTPFTLPRSDKVNGTNDKGNSYSGYVYYIPPERTYLDANEYILSNEAHGLSNSRAYPGLAELNNGQLQGSGKNMPYFNKSFVTGDNEKNTVYGRVYENVSFDFKVENINGEDYFYYDSTKEKYATRLTQNTKTKKYYMDYTGKGVKKADGKYSSQTTYQFYPFNSEEANSDFYRENLMFGMKLNIPFVTYEDPNRRTGIFKFSGDDDVWIYIDDELALDIGGTHTAVGGVIDMKTGYAVVGSTYADSSGESDNAKTDSITNKEKAAFAVATLDGVYSTNGSKAAAESSFFDDTFTPSGDVTYMAYVDETNGRYEVRINGSITYTYYDSSGAIKTPTLTFNNELFSFVLKKIECIADTNVGADGTEAHDLDIYYMERGLNSSNFKLAFKLANSTEREAEKRWPDGEVSRVDHSGDSVAVQLYRALKRTTQEAGEYIYDFEDSGQLSSWYAGGNSSIERVGEVVHSGNASLKAAGRSEAYQGPQIDLPTSEYRPGESYNFSVWAMYTNAFTTANKQATKYHFADFESNTVGWGPRGAAEVNTTTDQKHQGQKSLYVSGRTENWNGASTVLETSQYRPGNSYSFSMYVTHTVPASAVDYQLTLQYDADGQTKYSQIAYGTVNSPGDWIQLNNPSYQIPQNASNVILYVEAPNSTNDFYIDDVVIAEAGAVIDGLDAVKTEITDSDGTADSNAPAKFKMSLRYTDTNGDTKFRTVKERAVVNGQWVQITNEYKMPEDMADDHCTLYIETDVGAADFYIDDAVIERPVTHNTKVDLISADKNDTENQPAILDNSNNWYHLWDGLLESEIIDGEEVYYEYFIRELSVNRSSGNTTKYKTTYYNKETGQKLEPVTLSYTDGNGIAHEIIVYPISKGAAVEIVNSALTDLTVRKEWGFGLIEKPITVDIYSVYDGSEPELLDTVTLSGPDWTAELQELPLYKRDENGEYHLIKYYGVETNAEENYTVNYSSTDSIEVDGRTAYRFTPTDNQNVLGLTVTNFSETARLFKIKLKKVSSESNDVYIEGAVFDLYKSDDGGTTFSDDPIAFGSTDANGELILGTEGFEPDKVYKLVERQSALGYITDKTPMIFKVTKDSEGKMEYELIDQTVESGTLYKKAEIIFDENDGYFLLTFTLTNTPYKITMPSTGGGGIVYLFAGAFGMMIMSLILLSFAERRSDQ